MHKHPHEQSGYVISGEYRVVIDDTGGEIGPGDSYSIPRNVGHGIEIMDHVVKIRTSSVHQEGINSMTPANALNGFQPPVIHVSGFMEETCELEMQSCRMQGR